LLFKRAVFGAWSMPRLAAIAALALVAAIGRDWPPIALALSALVILAVIAWQDTRVSHPAQYPDLVQT
jgi:hypothetical protein